MKNKNLNFQKGMSYVELIVVLAIFFIMTGVVLFNSSNFRSRVELKSLANDIALKVVEAQKSAMSGKLPPYTQQEFLLNQGISDWKPAYGLYFEGGGQNDTFKYFADLDNDNMFNIPDYELLDTLITRKGNTISQVIAILTDGTTIETKSLSFVSTRPNSGFVFFVDDGGEGGYLKAGGEIISGVVRSEIVLNSSNGLTNRVVVYASGRVEIQ